MTLEDALKHLGYDASVFERAPGKRVYSRRRGETEKRRAVFKYLRDAGLGYEHIADLCGCSHSAVHKSLVYSKAQRAPGRPRREPKILRDDDCRVDPVRLACQHYAQLVRRWKDVADSRRRAYEQGIRP